MGDIHVQIGTYRLTGKITVQKLKGSKVIFNGYKYYEAYMLVSHHFGL